jgi:hypothetical protein
MYKQLALIVRAYTYDAQGEISAGLNGFDPGGDGSLSNPIIRHFLIGRGLCNYNPGRLKLVF